MNRREVRRAMRDDWDRLLGAAVGACFITSRVYDDAKVVRIQVNKGHQPAHVLFTVFSANANEQRRGHPGPSNMNYHESEDFKIYGTRTGEQYGHWNISQGITFLTTGNEMLKHRLLDSLLERNA